MGGDGQVYSDTFRVGAGKVLIGDANQDGYVEAADAHAMLKNNINNFDKTTDKVGTEK